MKIMRISALTFCSIGFLSATASTSVYAATDAFITFAPHANGALSITGESQDQAFKGAIAVKEFKVDVENVTTIGSATSGAGGGKAKLNNLVIKKSVDKATPILFQALATGAHYPSLTLSIRKSGPSGTKPGAYFVMKFSMVFVTKIATSSSSGDIGQRLP